jgi:hypothetical protein
MRADTSAIPGDVAKAKAQVDAAAADTAAKATEATNKQTAATSALGEKLKQVKKTYGEQIEIVQGLLGKIFAVGAIATTFYKIGEAISTYVIERLKTANQRAEEFRATLDKTNTAASQVKIADKFDELNKKLMEVNAQVRPITNVMLELFPNFAGLLADDANKIRDELKNLNDIAQATANNARRIRGVAQAAADAQEAERYAKQLEALNAINSKAIFDSLGEEEQLEAEAQARILEIIKAHNALAAADRLAKAGETKAAIEAIERTLGAEMDKRAKAAADEAAKKAEEERKKREAEQEEYRKWWAEQEEAQRKQAEAAAKARDAWVQSLKAIRSEINATFGAETANSITQFGQQIQGLGMATSANMNRIVVEGVG